MMHISPILAGLAILSVVNANSTLPSGAPARIVLPDDTAIRHFSATIEEPALNNILLAVNGLRDVSWEQPAGQAGSSQPAPDAQAFDRKALLDKPAEYVGHLLEVSGQFVETQQLSLTAGPSTLPGRVWSTLLIDGRSRQPVQILTLEEPAAMRRLANAHCVGYFYKIRLDQARKPGRDGQRATVDIPVLVGWVWQEQAGPSTSKSTFAYWVFPAILGGVFVGFLLVAMATRRRTDWRTRLERSRRRRYWRVGDEEGPQEDGADER